MGLWWWLTWFWRPVDDGRSSREERGRGIGRGRDERRLGRMIERNSRSRRKLRGSYLWTKLLLLTGRERERERESTSCKCMV